MNSTKGAHELQNENSRAELGSWKKRTLDDLPLIHPLHYCCATLINRKSTTVQAPRSRHAVQGTQ